MAVEDDSPGEKMSLRKKIKPPKPFTGDVIDNLSSSIQGERAIYSSDMEQTTPKSREDSPSGGSLQPESTVSEKIPPKKSYKRKAQPSAPRKYARMSRQESEESEVITRGRSRTRSGAVWRPGAGMTPANNKKYLGLQTEFNPNLPPARFPTYGSEQYLRDKAAGRNITPDSRSSPQRDVEANGSDQTIKQEETSSEEERRRNKQEQTHVETTLTPQRLFANHTAVASKTTVVPPPNHTSSNVTKKARVIIAPECPPPRLPPGYELSSEERLRSAKKVSQIHQSHELVKALNSCTSLTTPGYGVHGLSARELQSQGPLAGDMAYEEWRRSMARRWERGERTEEREALEEVLDDDILGEFGNDWMENPRDRQ